ncbi:MAG: GNAT family N-acetyltransferase [Thermodesulfobacteriota bacterium]
MIISEKFPTLETGRLILRQFNESDSTELKGLAGAREIAEGTFVPHPYEEGFAEEFIDRQYRDYKRGSLINFAVEIKEMKVLAGSIGISIDRKLNQGEMGFWIGIPYWGRGYCTEAAKAVMDYGFDVQMLDRICAFHFEGNTASGKVLKKIGMKYEGIKKDEYWHMGKLKDTEHFGIKKSEYQILKRD